jgi:hypothetical protein
MKKITAGGQWYNRGITNKILSQLLGGEGGGDVKKEDNFD